MVLRLGLAALCLTLSTGVHAQVLRWAVQAEPQTLDPHALLHLPTNALLMQVYEGLLRYGQDYELEPALAARWQWLGPRKLRFHLRRGVRFHDGSGFSAEDVVYSFERLRQPQSQLRVQLEGVREVRRVDAYTVDLLLDGPQPLLLRNLVDAKVLPARWCRERGVEPPRWAAVSRPAALAQESNGTGPYRVQSWTPGRELRLLANAQWWDRQPLAVREARMLLLPTDASRTAALLAGEVDLVTELPPQDMARVREHPDLRVQLGPEIRTLFVALDQRPVALAPGQAQNPLRDLRVRQALNLATDRPLLRDAVLSGLARPAALMVAPGVLGHVVALDESAGPDLDTARRLLVDAGYPEGFALRLHCPRQRYPRDEALCLALAQQWARIGLKVEPVTAPFPLHLQAIQGGQARVYLYGWTAPNLDAQFTLNALARSAAPDGAGPFNHSHVKDEELDRLIDRLKTAESVAERQQLAALALQRVRDQHWFVPLFHTVRAWGLRRGLQALHRMDERPELRWISPAPPAQP